MIKSKLKLISNADNEKKIKILLILNFITKNVFIKKYISGK